MMIRFAIVPLLLALKFFDVQEERNCFSKRSAGERFIANTGRATSGGSPGVASVAASRRSRSRWSIKQLRRLFFVIIF